MPTSPPVILYNNFSTTNPVKIEPGVTVVGVPGTVNGDAVYAANYPWQITNYGTVQGTGASSDGAQLTSGGTLQNFGLVVGTANGIAAAGSITGDAGVVQNYGTIATSGNTGNGVDLTAGGSVLNGSSSVSSASIQGGSRAILISGGSGSVTNYGMIGATSTTSTGIELDAGGNVINQNIIAAYNGIRISGGLGSVINTGTISQQTRDICVYLQTGGYVGNLGGLIDGSSAAVGIEVLNGAGTVTNSGMVVGGNEVVFLYNGGMVTNSGTLAFNGTKAAVDVRHAAGVVNNSGLIESGGTAVQLVAGGAIANTGSIAGSVIFDGNGVLTNSGKISSGSRYLAYLAGGSVTNTGDMTAGQDGIRLLDGTITNSGTVTAAGTGVYIYGGTLTNAGTISGSGAAAVTFAGANDRLIVQPGAVFSGTVNGGSGNTILELAAGGSPGILSGLGASVVGFSALVFDTGASWDVLWPVPLLRPAPFPTAVIGFAQNDTIDAQGLVANSDTYANGVLTLENNGTAVAQITLYTPVTNPTFMLSPDGGGGTNITVGAVYAQFAFIAGPPVNLVVTPDGQNLPPPISGDFNIELVTSPDPNAYPDETPYPLPPGYQGTALILNGGTTLMLLHGTFGVSDTGGGNDALVLGTPGTVDLSQISGFASVLLSSNGANTAILPASLLNTAPNGVLSLVGGNSGNIVSSAGQRGTTLSYQAGPGTDQFYGGGETDQVHVPIAALSGDTLAGGGPGSTLYVQGAGTADLSRVSGFTNVILDPGGTNTAILSANILNSAPSEALTLVGGNQGNIVASAGQSGRFLSYQAGTGSDTFRGGGENDLLYVPLNALSGDSLIGGTGNSVLYVLGAGTAELSGVGRFGTVALSSSGPNTVILSASELNAAPNGTLSLVGGNAGNTVASGASSGGLLLYSAGNGADQFYGGGEADQVYVSLQALGGDILQGGYNAANGLFIGGAGTVNLAGVGRFGSVFLGSAAGSANTVMLNDAVLAAAPVLANGETGIGIHAGSGNDKVDASAVANSSHIIAFVGGAGGDTFIGGAGNDFFYFGGGYDTVTGGGGADSFIFNNSSGLPVSAMDQIITDFTPSQSDVIDLSQFTQGYTPQSDPNQFAQLVADPHGGLDLMFSASGNGSFTEAAWLQSGDQGLSISQLVQAHNLLL